MAPEAVRGLNPSRCNRRLRRRLLCVAVGTMGLTRRVGRLSVAGTVPRQRARPGGPGSATVREGVETFLTIIKSDPVALQEYVPKAIRCCQWSLSDALPGRCHTSQPP